MLFSSLTCLNGLLPGCSHVDLAKFDSCASSTLDIIRSQLVSVNHTAMICNGRTTCQSMRALALNRGSKIQGGKIQGGIMSGWLASAATQIYFVLKIENLYESGVAHGPLLYTEQCVSTTMRNPVFPGSSMSLDGIF
jgi:hypothetical protein